MAVREWQWCEDNPVGQDASEAMLTWWTDLMSAAPPQVLERLLAHIAGVDLTPHLGSIRTPTLMISGAGSVLASADTVEQWTRAIPNCRLHIIPGTSYHLAATHVAECARVTLEFLRQLGCMADSGA